jgi:C_GCAxxG_C_C family probable redox protein
MEIIKALTPFPGIGGNVEICGAISGSLINFGLFFNSANLLDISNARKTMTTSQEFMLSFKDKTGYWYCADILEKVILRHKLNPGESQEAMATFAKEKGFEKCGLPPGTGARLAADFIIKSINT